MLCTDNCIFISINIINVHRHNLHQQSLQSRVSHFSQNMFPCFLICFPRFSPWVPSVRDWDARRKDASEGNVIIIYGNWNVTSVCLLNILRTVLLIYFLHGGYLARDPMICTLQYLVHIAQETQSILIISKNKCFCFLISCKKAQKNQDPFIRTRYLSV